MEPSKIDKMVDDFKSAIMATAKEELVEEMDALRKENEELRNIRDKWDAKISELESEYAAKRNELEKRLREAEAAADNAKRMRLFDLIRDYPDHAYTVDMKYIQQPKCDKCNALREIKFTSPLGRTMYEKCECASTKPVYSVRAIPLVEITCHWNGDPCVKYLYNNDIDADWLRFATKFFDNTPFNQIDIFRETPLFRSEDRAKQYVEWMNNQESSHDTNG